MSPSPPIPPPPRFAPAPPSATPPALGWPEVLTSFASPELYRLTLKELQSDPSCTSIGLQATVCLQARGATHKHYLQLRLSRSAVGLRSVRQTLLCDCAQQCKLHCSSP